MSKSGHAGKRPRSKRPQPSDCGIELAVLDPGSIHFHLDQSAADDTLITSQTGPNCKQNQSSSGSLSHPQASPKHNRLSLCQGTTSSHLGTQRTLVPLRGLPGLKQRLSARPLFTRCFRSRCKGATRQRVCPGRSHHKLQPHLTHGLMPPLHQRPDVLASFQLA